MSQGSEVIGTHLRGHPVTEVHDGDVVGLWPLVHTQVAPQTVLQLRERERESERAGERERVRGGRGGRRGAGGGRGRGRDEGGSWG